MPDPSRPGTVDVSALVERARRRDPAAFRELFRSNLSFVHRVVCRIYGSGPEVEDLVQTAFVEAFRSLPDFRGDALFSTWLARITVRVALRAAKQRPHHAVPLDEQGPHAADAPSPERVAAARQALNVLTRLLGELRPKRRAAFVLNVLEGYSTEEAAALLGVSTNALKVRVHDARRQIEKSLRHHPDLLAALSPRQEAL